jgi:hypothetical protein
MFAGMNGYDPIMSNSDEIVVMQTQTGLVVQPISDEELFRQCDEAFNKALRR